MWIWIYQTICIHMCVRAFEYISRKNVLRCVCVRVFVCFMQLSG